MFQLYFREITLTKNNKETTNVLCKKFCVEASLHGIEPALDSQIQTSVMRLFCFSIKHPLVGALPFSMFTLEHMYVIFCTV